MASRGKSLFLIFFLFFASSVNAADFIANGPLTLRNQNPVYLEFINLEPTRAVCLPKAKFSVRVDNEYSNIFETATGNNTGLLLDMELLRTALHLDAGVYDNMEAGIEVPFIRLDTGFLDAFLQKYHRTFGFPNGGRESVANGGFGYRFSEGGVALYDVAQEDLSLGDITLNFKHNFWEGGRLRPAAAWLFYLKLPTGDRGEGLGSGNADFGLAAALEKSYRRWHGYLNLGYFVNGGHAPLQNYINDVYFSYMLGGEFSVTRPVSILAQISGGTPILKGMGSVGWDSFPMDLQMGLKGEYHLNGLNGVIWQAGFSEDINPNGPSVDITILGSVGFRFGKE